MQRATHASHPQPSSFSSFTPLSRQGADQRPFVIRKLVNWFGAQHSLFYFFGVLFTLLFGIYTGSLLGNRHVHAQFTHFLPATFGTANVNLPMVKNEFLDMLNETWVEEELGTTLHYLRTCTSTIL